jgi:sugar phosphate isomerase/epimerase
LIADSKAAGFQYFVIPVPPMGHFKFNVKERSMGMSDEVVFINDVLNTIGEKCAAQGLKLLYHNHDFEFKPNAQGVVPMDYFLEHTNPAWVNFQMDLFWVTTAGVDPVNYINKYPGRFKMWHVKDRDAQGRFAPVGLGTIDFARILSHAATSGLEYYIVEQDMVFDGMQPLEAIKISHDNLSKFGFH